ncbi:MAG: AbrB/MazE/SpoVT family DNA-binding domain-containing protein [Candidatus Diapherotrites archaeon]|uniref:AbrB/MazE/SpoVT family DNA-binding domain-containing protein n=1 Tax=Candidatus Iainarchaeum sp. TaxID=3101447 RepID=A0A8T3YPC6_9ARCH|nr:AbrB/MazE/SpoVT family DNA-binding domain-containing protein [Candidatus Diapherotrites archaeon]
MGMIAKSFSRKGMECGKCGHLAGEASLSFQGHEINGWKCRCGEEYFNPEQAQKILTLNKLKNSKFEVKVGQIRSNLIVRIPKEVEEALGLRKGEEMLLGVLEGRKIELMGK